MKIIPTWPIAVTCLAIGVIAGGITMKLWYADDISDRDLTISNLQKDAAVKVSNQSQKALADLAEAASNINTASKNSQADITNLGVKLDAIDRRYRNAKAPSPLPADCRPGNDRVRRLTESTAAVNEAIARPASSK